MKSWNVSELTERKERPGKAGSNQGLILCRAVRCYWCWQLWAVAPMALQGCSCQVGVCRAGAECAFSLWCCAWKGPI